MKIVVLKFGGTSVGTISRIKKVSKPSLMKGYAITSSRRWEKYGFLKTIFLMRFLRFLYFLGVNDKFLASIYK